jgi:ubiquinone/menaquinone biosynthesis C-methylase UbiE
MNSGANYNHVAPVYDFLVKLIFGKKFTDAEKYYLDQLGRPANILVFGGGSGNILKPLLELYPHSQIHFLEASLKMISKARSQSFSGIENVQFIHGTEKHLVGCRDKYDVVITSFVLDVFEDLELGKVIDVLNNVLALGGFWLQTDFYVYKGHPWWQRGMVWMMYLFFNLTANQKNLRLPDFASFFNRMSLKQLAEKSCCNNMVRTILYHKV